MRDRLYLYDTTLRDGQQSQGVQVSTEEPGRMAQALDAPGIDDIEGGWPGANRTDSALVNALSATRATLAAFGTTKQAERSAENDDVLMAMRNAGTPAVCLVAKAHDFHVTQALGIGLEETHPRLGRASGRGRPRGDLDAEHVFDGFRTDAAYGTAAARAAVEAGARWVVLCDTNTGAMPAEIAAGVEAMMHAGIPGSGLGIHTHDDAGQAVANFLAAGTAGAVCRSLGLRPQGRAACQCSGQGSRDPRTRGARPGRRCPHRTDVEPGRPVDPAGAAARRQARYCARRHSPAIYNEIKSREEQG